MSIKAINRGDLIQHKDGRKFTVEALRYVGDKLHHIEGVDRTSNSPMRTTIWANDFDKVIKRAPKVMDWDLRRECELQTDGTTYLPVERREEQDFHYLKILKLRSDRRKIKFEYKKLEAAK